MNPVQTLTGPTQLRILRAPLVQILAASFQLLYQHLRSEAEARRQAKRQRRSALCTLNTAGPLARQKNLLLEVEFARKSAVNVKNIWPRLDMKEEK